MRSKTAGQLVAEMRRDASDMREVDRAAAALIRHYANRLEAIVASEIAEDYAAKLRAAIAAAEKEQPK